MALLNTADLFIVNRAADQRTYKVTSGEVASFVLDILGGGTGSSGLILNNLGDVEANELGMHPVGSFLMNNQASPGSMIEADFKTEVDLIIDAYLVANPPASPVGSVFDLTDVTATALGTDPETYVDAAYEETVLYGQKSSTGGTKEFKPVKLVDLVEPIVNGQDPSGDPFIKLATVDLTDVRDSNSYTTDDILIYDPTSGVAGEFINGNIVNIVTNILNGQKPGGGADGGINIDIKPDFLPIGRYYNPNDSSQTELGQSGIVAVKMHAGTDADPQVLTVVNGVLDVEIPEIPDAFKYEGNVYFNEAGNPFKEETADTPFPSSATVPPAERGMIYVALVTDGANTGTDPVDPSAKRPLLGWKSYTGSGDVAVENGSLVVCTTSDAENGGNGALFAEMGVIDYTPVEQGLQEVLDTDNTASNKDIVLTSAGVELKTLGSFITEAGNFTTSKGDITTHEGTITNTKGDIVIGVKGTQNPLEGTLSVPDIDFNRFELLSNA